MDEVVLGRERYNTFVRGDGSSGGGGDGCGDVGDVEGLHEATICVCTHRCEIYFFPHVSSESEVWNESPDAFFFLFFLRLLFF